MHQGWFIFHNCCMKLDLVHQLIRTRIVIFYKCGLNAKKSLLQLFQILLSGCWDFLPEVLNTLHQSLPLFFILESVDILCCHVAASLGNIVDDNEAAGKLLKSPEVG